MYKLYYYPSNASIAPHMLLEEIGCPYELVLVDRAMNAHKSPEYLNLNPTGVIPALIDGAQPIHQTAAICIHLTDEHPEANLAPLMGSALRPIYYQWMMYLTNTLQPELMTYYYPERLADDAAMAQRVEFHAERRIGDMLDILDSHISANGPFMLGAQYSAADIMLYMLCRWTRMHAHPAQARKNLRQHIELLSARPAIARTFAQEKLPLAWY